MKEVQRMRLDDLAVMQQAAELLRGRGQRSVAGDDVHRLGRREQVAHRADAAQPLHGDRNLPIRAALDEDFEAPEFDDVQPDLVDAILLIEEDRDLAVAFDSGDRLDGDPPQPVRGFGRF